MERLIESVWVSVKYGTIGLLIAAIIFPALEQNFALRKSKKSWGATALDLKYFFVNLLHPPVISFGIAAFFAFFMIKRDGPPSPVSALGFAGELLAVVFACDVLVYVRHRAFHSRGLWGFHSIHHSSEEVNWTSATRFHILENVIEAAGEITVFSVARVAGANPHVIVTAGIVIGMWDFLIHSNLRWTFWPIRHILASPVQHRWHHSDSLESMDKNFAAMFSCIDVAMRTFYMPEKERPKTTGLYANEKKTHPRTFLGQLVYPFRSH